MFPLLRSREELELGNAGAYVDSLETLVYFADNVAISKQKSIWEQSHIQKCNRAFQSVIEKHGVKILKPLQRLCLRYLEEACKGYTDLHYLLLGLCIKFRKFKVALPIIQYEAIPKQHLLRKEDLVVYFYYEFSIFKELRMYKEAHKSISFAKSLDTDKLQNKAVILKCHIVSSLVSGIPYSEERLNQEIRMMAHRETGLLGHARFGFTGDDEFQKSFDLFKNLKAGMTLSKDQQKILKEHELYHMFKAASHTEFREYLVRTIVGSDWRIKSTEVNNYKLDDWEVIRQTNTISPIYKYDCKNRHAYFNHTESDQAKLNSSLSTSVNLYKEVANSRFQRKEEKSVMGGGMMGLMSMMRGGF